VGAGFQSIYASTRRAQLWISSTGRVFSRFSLSASALDSTTTWNEHRTTVNTTIDPNGFIKAASPIINLYADAIELNDAAKQQNIDLVVNGVGDYTITGTSGFAQEGWYIETPTDANKNVKCYTEYEQVEQEDGTFNINVKTYVPDYSTGPATAGDPCDITAGRFISIRMQALPTPEPDPVPDSTDAA